MAMQWLGQVGQQQDSARFFTPIMQALAMYAGYQAMSGAGVEAAGAGKGLEAGADPFTGSTLERDFPNALESGQSSQGGNYGGRSDWNAQPPSQTPVQSALSTPATGGSVSASLSQSEPNLWLQSALRSVKNMNPLQAVQMGYNGQSLFGGR